MEIHAGMQMASVGVSQLKRWLLLLLLLLRVAPKAFTLFLLLLKRERSASSESILGVGCFDSNSNSCNDGVGVEGAFGRSRHSGLMGAKLSLHLMQHASSSDDDGILMVGSTLCTGLK